MNGQYMLFAYKAGEWALFRMFQHSTLARKSTHHCLHSSKSTGIRAMSSTPPVVDLLQYANCKKTAGVESLVTRLVHDANVKVIQVTVVITICKDILIVQRSHVAFVQLSISGWHTLIALASCMACSISATYIPLPHLHGTLFMCGICGACTTIYHIICEHSSCGICLWSACDMN